MTDRLRVRFNPSLPEHSRRLLETLGVEIIYDQQAPTRCDCDGCQAYRAEQQRRRDDRKQRARERNR